jgi:(4-alkanoyl-5-oxo-2,5-dihydrofuran-3-yl)methyl phosphate reductase
MLLVTGATGTVGRQLIGRLVGMGVSVRALSRDPRAASLPRGVEVVGGDLNRPDSLPAALAGVERVFLVTSGVERARQDANLVAAARTAGARHVVKLSALTVGDESQADVINRWHAQGERIVVDSGLEWTFLRPGAFMSNALAWIPMVKEQGAVFAPFSRARIAAIDPADIAAVAARVLAEDDHHGRVYELTGPELISVEEQVDQLGRALGRSLRLVDVPAMAARRRMIDAGLPTVLADAVLAMHAAAGNGADGAIRSTVAQLTGQPARRFADWAGAHADLFR